MEIDVLRADITGLAVDAIVSPANSMVTMGGGLAGVIRRRGGESIRDEARRLAPVPVGKAVITGAGKLPCRRVIHAPTMERPAMKVGSENARLAMHAALECADGNGIRVLAVPGLGTGVGGVSPVDAARVMAQEVRAFRPRTLEKVILVAFDDGMHEAFLRHA